MNPGNTKGVARSIVGIESVFMLIHLLDTMRALAQAPLVPLVTAGFVEFPFVHDARFGFLTLPSCVPQGRILVVN